MSPIRSSPLNLEKYRFAPAGARVSSPNIISFSAAASRKNETVQIDKETILPVPGQNVGHDCTADGVEGMFLKKKSCCPSFFKQDGGFQGTGLTLLRRQSVKPSKPRKEKLVFFSL